MSLSRNGMLLLCAALVIACSDSPGPPRGAPSGPAGTSKAVATVEVTPATSTIVVGAKQSYVAVARDGDGRTLSGISFVCVSSEPQVAAIVVSPEGCVATGVAPGTTMITASVGGVTSAPAILNVVRRGGGVTLSCGGTAVTVHGWEGTISWSYELQRTGQSVRYQPRQTVSVTLKRSVSLSIRADDAEIYPGPDGSPIAANWFASSITGSVTVDDRDICSSCDPRQEEHAQGSGPPLTERAGGQAGRDPNFTTFVVSVNLASCTYTFNVGAYVDGVQSEHPDQRNVPAGGLSPAERSIADGRSALTGGGSFPVWYNPEPSSGVHAIGVGGLSSNIDQHGFGTNGDSTAKVSWSFTPILR